jgi:uncharacterized membrane protein
VALELAAAEPLTRADRWWTAAAGATAALAVFRAVPPVALQLTSFAVPGQSNISTDALLRVLGFATGLAGVAVAAFVLVRAAAGAKPLAVRAAAAVAIAAAAGAALVGFVQLLVARRLVTLPRPGFRAMVWAINHSTLWLFVLAVAVVAAPAAAFRANRRPVLGGANPAVDRLAKARARRGLRYTFAGVVALVGLGWVVTGGAALDGRAVELSPPEPFETTATTAVVPLAAVDDGHLHRFAYTTADGVVVRFIVIKKNGVAYGVGLDACELCGPTGYYERDGKIICLLCDVIMNIATIGFKGGCNPIPLDHAIDGGNLVVQLADLEAAAGVFA